MPGIKNRKPEEILNFAVRLAYEEPEARKALLPVLKGEKPETVESLKAKLAYLLHRRKTAKTADVRSIGQVIRTIQKLLVMADPSRGGSKQERENALRSAQSRMEKYRLDPRQFPLYQKIMADLRAEDKEKREARVSALHHINKFLTIDYKLDAKLKKLEEGIGKTKNIEYKGPLMAQVSAIRKAMALIRRNKNHLIPAASSHFDIQKRAAFFSPIQYTNVGVKMLLNKVNRMGIKEDITDMLWAITKARHILNKPFKGDPTADKTIQTLKAVSQALYLMSGGITSIINELEKLVHQRTYDQAPMKVIPINLSGGRPIPAGVGARV